MDFKSYFITHRERFIEDWKEFLRFKSVSTDPAYADDCEACAHWVAAQITSLGGKAELLRGQGKPVVFGEIAGDPTKPTILFYGHYDVQPVDPIELWKSNPFEPTLRDGRMYARGAQDNKGQVTYFLKALDALKASGAKIPTIKLLIEGEEECGSGVMNAEVAHWAAKIKADILMICDTGMITPTLPTVTVGLRGIISLEVKVHGAKMDLHSGMYGGMVKNPLQALVGLVAGAYNSDGSVAIPGFYDGVSPPTATERAFAAKTPLDPSEVEAMLGVPLTGGEPCYTAVERRGFRPTLEINGIGGGYQGQGGKTVIPNYAFVKITSRLVAGQDPQATLDAIISYFEKSAPPGVRIEISSRGVGGAALRLPTDSAVLKNVVKVLKEEFATEPVLLWEGASIPIIPVLQRACGGEPILVGFGLEEDLIHAPNESFSLEQFEQGYRYVTSFISSL